MTPFSAAVQQVVHQRACAARRDIQVRLPVEPGVEFRRRGQARRLADREVVRNKACPVAHRTRNAGVERFVEQGVVGNQPHFGRDSGFKLQAAIG